jgi:hypothetical protein
MSLEEESLQLAAFGLLLGLDPVKRELESAGGSQPGLKQGELDSRWRCVREQGVCSCHISYGIITVRMSSPRRTPRKGSRRSKQGALLERYAQRFSELKRDLGNLEYFCKGTVMKRMMKCGKAHCACASNPSKRHGPYFELTYKATGKTVNVKLSPKAAPLYQAASLHYRKLKALLNRLERLSLTILQHQAKLAESKRYH